MTTAARDQKTTRPRLPEWLRTELPSGEALRLFNRTDRAVEGNDLHTVCEEARCPNIHDCWGRGTATFMVAGKSCTRGCRFCSVDTLRLPPALEADEPERLADAVERMGLKYVVVTVVNRDDLADGGASHYRACVEAVHRRLPECGIELLGSDLAGDLNALRLLLGSTDPEERTANDNPNRHDATRTPPTAPCPLPAALCPLPLRVFAHNVECVPRLDKLVRDPRASFDQSLAILREAKRLRPGGVGNETMATKTSLMVGLGETDHEVLDALRRVRDEASVDIVTLGQYLTPGRPDERFLPVDRYVAPQQFDDYAQAAREMGFAGVAAGPLVRSSFRAGVLYEATRTGRSVDELLAEDEPQVVTIGTTDERG
ncbi:MAG: lipoyl synthase [Lacipirellulaceae bacterium]